ncbi:MAG: MFS transporter, partial [Micrococcaceae bacterium]|nr:MFS transporter [Micrococcaceae bacterium]
SGAFGVAMSLLVAKAASPAAAGTLSALAQGIGFVLAAIGSAVVGSLRLSTGSWDAGLWIMAALALVFGAAVIAVAGRPASGQRGAEPQAPVGSGNR